jgi:hypothetical protein
MDGQGREVLEFTPTDGVSVFPLVNPRIDYYTSLAVPVTDKAGKQQQMPITLPLPAKNVAEAFAYMDSNEFPEAVDTAARMELGRLQELQKQRMAAAHAAKPLIQTDGG